jgi:hypothetical protein
VRKSRPLAHSQNRLEGGEVAYEIVDVDNLGVEVRNVDPTR